ncbi:urease accessory protein UreE [Methylovirgula sp. 4M-Z18]|uniref:urease accessory protein UreE n=1 Tax=Methylovirgula sp. 4M-Z18 TaxID=2293567 RepID=UPI000E2EB903|nr:urease accessory protein UreE [Methylovirgula sp. 4M-Z18]RFB79197.1 urease accessory protein UreE [Methylovirgula sp. 4M-Z18]
MVRATQVLARGSWHQDAADSVVLEFDDRHRRRVAMKGVRGVEFLLDLPEAFMLRSGDGLALEDGRVVEVVAAPEALLEIRCATPTDLTRVAWHLGNRHLPVQVLNNKLRIRADHVIEEMLKGLGAKVVAIEAPFDPEGGAYAGGHDDHEHGHHDHDHHHGHDHDHQHHHGHTVHDHHGHIERAHVDEHPHTRALHDPHDHDHDACGCGHAHHDHKHKHG